MILLHARPEPGFADLPRVMSAAGGGPRLAIRAEPGRAAWLHFIPGNGFCGGVYWPFLSRFTPDHGLFLHDIEGHGDSEAPKRFSGIAAVARRVPAVLAEQLPAPAQPLVGMGHSFGAALTLKVAADNPGLFSALVLLDPILFPPTVWFGARFLSAIGAHPMTRAARRRRRSWPSRQKALDHLRGRGIYKGWAEESLEAFVDHATTPQADGSRLLSCPPGLEAQIYGRPVYPWDLLPKIDVPVLFLHGASSYPFFPEATRRARKLNPRVEVATVAGAHCFMQEHPGQAHAAVAGFLGRHGLTGGAATLRAAGTS